MTDRQSRFYDDLQRRSVEQGISSAGTILYGLLVLYAIHYALTFFDYPLLAPQELLWNAIVYLLPARLLLDSARREELRANDMLSQTHAAKSDALRRMLGLGGSAVMQNMPASGIMRRAGSALFAPPKMTSDAPPGLGNWDNSCYQNSVLQGLASLDSLRPYLERTTERAAEDGSTSGSLLETVEKLKSADNNGKQLWTPAKLKSMSSWQQQDAQEYFSKIMDELDKEAAKVTAAAEARPGLETVAEEEQSRGMHEEAVPAEQHARNPVEGLLAQKVTCTKCGFSEGLSMIPFNCLTVPLGSDFAYDLDECLDEYTKLEEISDVECTKCTLLRAEQQLTAMLPKPPTSNDVEEQAGSVVDNKKMLALPPEVRAQAFKRLAAVQTALEEDDFEDKTVAEKCEIGKKARVSSTKTRQAVIARAPSSLVIHVNRSVFDEMTGAQRKNYASVRWPSELGLGEWMLRSGLAVGASLLDGDEGAATGPRYRIKAAVTHYGRHENGHYICYRRHPVHVRDEAVADQDGSDEEAEDIKIDEAPQKFKERWWRLSDEDVSSVSEDEVLAQGGVFMLFYERLEETESPAQLVEANVAAIEEVEETVVADAAADLRAEPVASELGPSEGSAVTQDASALDSSATVSLPNEGREEAREAADPTGTRDIADPTATRHDETPLVVEEAPQPLRKSPTPPLMRTARGRQASKSENMDAFGGMGGMRRMAAT